MAFLASNLIPQSAYQQAKQTALNLRTLAVEAITLTAAGSDAERLLGLLVRLRATQSALTQLATTPGIAAYAQEQEGDAQYDVAAEFTAMLATLDDTADWIAAAMPKDGSGYLLLWTLDVDTGNRVPRTFTGTQLATLGTKLQSIVNAVS